MGAVRSVLGTNWLTFQAREAGWSFIPVRDRPEARRLWRGGSDHRRAALSGKYRRNKAEPEGTRQVAGWGEPPVRDENALWFIVDELVATGRGARRSRRRGSRWPGYSDTGGGVTPICSRAEAQFRRDNLASVDVKLADDERARPSTRRAWSRYLPLLAPSSRAAKDRLGPADLALHAPSLK